MLVFPGHTHLHLGLVMKSSSLHGFQPGLEVIKFDFILKLKINCNDRLLADTCLQTRVRKQPIIVHYFEFETVLKFYNLEASS